MHGDIARISGIAQEITTRHWLESRCNNFGHQCAFFNAMGGLAHARALARSCRMIGNHQKATGLERIKHGFVHLLAINLHEGRVVIGEEESDEIKLGRALGQRVIKGARERAYIGHGRRLGADSGNQ